MKNRITKEEAIQILSTRDWSGMLCGYTSGYTEALDMAIEALTTQDKTQGDLTNRVDAIVERLRYLYKVSKGDDTE